jgi:hypothetical protein
MDTRFWGPSGWRLLHLTVAAPLQGRDEKKIIDFFSHLPYVLPCKFCRYSLSEYYEKRPMPNNYNKLHEWLYNIHNDVNGKLRGQNLLKVPNPTFKEIDDRYKQWVATPCATTKMLGWDFLFSVANTTPSKNLHSTPMDGAPENIHTHRDKNKWNTMSYSERQPYVQKWWNLLAHILPFEPWRKAWTKAEKVNGKAPVLNGKKATLAWLYKMERYVCKTMSEDAPHNSFDGLCKEVSAFSSGCGKVTGPRVKTCRAKKTAARETLRRQRNARLNSELPMPVQ